MRSSFVRSLVLPAVFVAAVALTPPTSASAEVVLSNLANTRTGRDTVNYQSWVGAAFQTDSQSWRLNSVTMDVEAGTSASGAGSFFTAIYNDVSLAPGTLLATLTGDTNPYTAGTYTYTAAGSGLLLDANTRYWVVRGLSDGSSNNGAYRMPYTGSGSSTGAWSIPSSKYQGYYTPGGSWDIVDFDRYKLEIGATVNSPSVPEIDPGSVGGVVALVTGALGWLERRRRRRA